MLGGAEDLAAIMVSLRGRLHWQLRGYAIHQHFLLGNTELFRFSSSVHS
jgi:hypothetical protein